MATSCKLDISLEEWKKNWIYSIEIPYEINHDFFMKARILIREGKIDWIPAEDLFSFADYWRWTILHWQEIDTLLDKINKFEFYIDKIINFVEIPKNISLHDSRIIVWYESNFKYDKKNNIWYDANPYTTYVITWENAYFRCEKRDIIYILYLIKKLCIKAKTLNKWIKFEWE